MRLEEGWRPRPRRNSSPSVSVEPGERTTSERSKNSRAAGCTAGPSSSRGEAGRNQSPGRPTAQSRAASKVCVFRKKIAGREDILPAGPRVSPRPYFPFLRCFSLEIWSGEELWAVGLPCGAGWRWPREGRGRSWAGD